ncbi:MAG: hypothetical protein ACI9R3_004920 [Verrucomicrobiales bacterium]
MASLRKLVELESLKVDGRKENEAAILQAIEATKAEHLLNPERQRDKRG